MSIKYDASAGTLNLGLYSLFEAVDDASKVDLIEQLSCEDAVIKHVADQIIDGYTQSMSCGLTGTAAPEPHTALDKAARRIAIASSDIAKREIERLQRELERCQKLISELVEERAKNMDIRDWK